MHLPKTAGTSVERTLAGPNQIAGGHSTAESMCKKWPNEWEEYFSFAIVRDPAARFLSAWSYLRQEPVHAAHNNRRLHELDTLGAFVEEVGSNPSMIHSMIHFIPQNRFVLGLNGQILVKQVYKFEELPSAWKDICGRLGIEKELPHLNQSKRIRASSKVRALVGRLYENDYRLFNY